MKIKLETGKTIKKIISNQYVSAYFVDDFSIHITKYIVPLPLLTVVKKYYFCFVVIKF